MSRVKILITGVAWNLSAQLGTAILQFLYAGVTSRLMGAEGFGAYAIALIVSGLVTLVANGGLGQSVSRMIEVDQSRLRGLTSYAVLLGLAGATALFFTAGLWASLWGSADSESLIRWLSLSALVAPHLSLVSGYLRRQSSFRSLAAATFFSNALGMTIGLAFVIGTRSPASLIASPVAAQIALWLILSTVTRWQLIRVGSLGHAREEIGFSWNVTIAGILAYLANNLSKWSVSRWVSPSTLGQWNRSDVVTVIPFFQLQTAISQVVYPEFRHDRNESERSRTVWPDLLGLVAWVAVPASCAGAVALPQIIPILFGPGWDLAAALSAPMSVICGVQVVTTVLGNAVEALGKFAWIWASQAIMILVQVVGVVATALTKSVIPAVISLGALVVGRQLWYLALCIRGGIIDGRLLTRNYAGVFGGSLVAAAGMFLVVQTADDARLLPVTVVSVAAGGYMIFRFRQHLPPIRILNQYRSLAGRHGAQRIQAEAAVGRDGGVGH